MDGNFWHEVKVVCKKNIRDFLNLNVMPFLLFAVVEVLVFNIVTAMMLTKIGEIPEEGRAILFSTVYSRLPFTALFATMFIAWMFSIHLFRIEIDKRIFETLLAGPLRLSSIYFGKILAFSLLFLPVYLAVLAPQVPVMVLIAGRYLAPLPSLEISCLGWLTMALIAPLFGIGAASVIGILELAMKPRVAIILTMAIFFGLGLFFNSMGGNEISTSLITILTIAASSLILIPALVMAKGYITNERVIIKE
jgi:hypothetical protein